MKTARLIILTALLPFSVASTALPTEDSLSLAERENTLCVAVDLNAFFWDNEFKGDVIKGYTLPGYWMRPRVTYNPTANMHLEAGVHGLLYEGASKYPNYAYHDIENWKAGQYQKGLHVVPWLRAEAYLNNVTVTVGALHREDGFHDLETPLYNREAELSADPEQGLEIRLNTPRYKLDTWVDWQSFIFNLDDHQEAFTFGLTQEVKMTNPHNSAFSLSIPLQALIQHRGGEIDDTDKGVQTLCNFGAGLRARWNVQNSAFNSIEWLGMGLFCAQQAGKIWPIDNGTALWTSAKATLWNHLRCELGYFYAEDFVNLYGAPYFGTISLHNDYAQYPHTSTAYYAFEYRYPMGKSCSLGVNAIGYTFENGTANSSFSFGVCFRSNLDFLIKDFKK